ncbi:HAD hydrolase-like protein [Candidatus Woesearchaeota archaeon]|nr:HAD hydrolase-like protein [Candidatus Woesearchaeota archaeon]
MVRLVIFDFWNTLAKNADGRSIEALRRKLCLPKGRLSRTRYWDFMARTSMVHPSGDPKRFFPRFLRTMGLAPSGERLETLCRFYDHIDRRTTYIAGMPAIVRQLKRRGYRLAIISETENSCRSFLDRNPRFASLFDVILLSFEQGMNKRGDGLYRRMASIARRRWGIGPQEIVMIGDSPRHDIAPARKVFGGAIRFRNTRALRQALRRKGIL